VSSSNSRHLSSSLPPSSPTHAEGCGQAKKARYSILLSDDEDDNYFIAPFDSDVEESRSTKSARLSSSSRPKSTLSMVSDLTEDDDESVGKKTKTKIKAKPSTQSGADSRS
jgi:hypothetical protein